MITGRLIFDISLVVLFASIFTAFIFCFYNWKRWKNQKLFWYLIILGTHMLLIGGLLLNNYLKIANTTFADQRLSFILDDSYWSIVGAFLQIIFIAVMIYGINQLTVYLMPIHVKGKKRLVTIFILLVIALSIIFLIIIRMESSNRLFLDAKAVVNGLLFPAGCLVAGIQAASVLIPATALHDKGRRKESLATLILLTPFLVFPIIDFIWLSKVPAQSYIRLSYFSITPMLISLFIQFRNVTDVKKDSITQNEPKFESICREFEISEREKDVLKLLIEGKSHQMIADTLYISINTVKSHLQRIYKKMAVSSKIQLLLKINSAKPEQM